MAFMELKDKVPPHNLEAEQAVLGALMLDTDAIHRIMTTLRAEDFYKQAHQKIYQAISNLSLKGQSYDLITLTDALRATHELELAGGSAYLASLPASVPSSANIEYYARIVRECAVRRGLIRVGAELGSQAWDESRESRQIIEDAEKNLFDLAENKAAQGFKRAGTLLTAVISRITEARESKNALSGIPTGFSVLDTMTSGFQNSEYIIIGARPSMGKTSLALSMAAKIALHKKIPTGFFTLEMPDIQIVQRLIAMEARINSHNIRSGLIRSQDYVSLTDAASIIYDSPLYISDWPGMPILDIRAQARQMVKEHGVKIIFIDYLGLITAQRPEVPRWEQFGDISRSLKALARELNIPVVTLSQVTRDTEGKEPTLSNIRESGSIEQDADMVIFLHRDRGAEREYGEQDEIIETKLIVAKQRNGPIGTVKIGFHSAYTRFDELETREPG